MAGKEIITESVVSRAIEEAGGVAALAAKLEVSIQLVSMWRKRDRVPAEQCIAVEKATDGRVTRYQLAPTVFGEEPAKAA